MNCDLCRAFENAVSISLPFIQQNIQFLVTRNFLRIRSHVIGKSIGARRGKVGDERAHVKRDIVDIRIQRPANWKIWGQNQIYVIQADIFKYGSEICGVSTHEGSPVPTRGSPSKVKNNAITPGTPTKNGEHQNTEMPLAHL